jgi:hypothetical protein
MKPARKRKDALLIALPCLLFALVVLISETAPRGGRSLAAAIEEELKD